MLFQTGDEGDEGDVGDVGGVDSEVGFEFAGSTSAKALGNERLSERHIIAQCGLRFSP